MKLGELLTAINRADALPIDRRSREIGAIAHDSRKVTDGTLFVAVRGFHSDGHQFISQALDLGAAAAVAEEGAETTGVRTDAVVRVPDTRRALADLAAAFYGHPSRRLRVVGITGTNGKTTTSYLIKAVIEAAGHHAGLIGTIDYRIGDRVYPAPNTTPESLELQALLAEMVDAGAGYCVMEVSSHALALGRTAGCRFETAVFTNLTQDHLDFHQDMESYFQAKLLLFTGLEPDKTTVVNGDDPASGEIIGKTRARAITYGLTGAPDIHPAGAIAHGIEGISCDVETPRGIVRVASPLVGMHNLYNILAAVGAGVALGIDGPAISRGIERMRAVPGRMEKVEEGQPYGVVVDYAHTEDALARLLDAVREVATGRVLTLFGCGGDRDRAKRPKMGAAALRGSDIVIVTSDNPRTEDAQKIIAEIETGMADGSRVADASVPGMAGGKPYFVVPERSAAIDLAISLALPGDVVVLAGKGHEDYQIIGERKHHFDDREEARTAIRKRRKT